MLQRSSFVLLKIYYLLSSKLYLIPFVWDSKTRQVKVSKNKWQLAVWFIMILETWWECGYQFYACVTYPFDPDFNSKAYLQLASHFVTRTTAIVYQVFTLLRLEDTCTFLNQLLFVSERFKIFYTRKECPDKMKRTLFIFIVIGFVHPIGLFFGYMGEYKAVRYWAPAVIPPFIYRYVYPVFGALEWYVGTYANIGVLIHFLPLLMNYKMNFIWMKMLHEKKFNFSASEDGINNEDVLYRTMQVMNYRYNDLFRSVWTFSLGGLISCHILVNCVLILFGHIIPVPEVLVFPLGAIIFFWIETSVFTGFSAFSEISEEFIRRKTMAVTSYEKAFGRSCRHLTIDCNFFAHQKATTFTFMGIVLDQTISVLML